MGKRARQRERCNRTSAQRILVLCEGKTERWYLNGCKVRGAGVDAKIKTASAQGEALVLAALAEMNNDASYDAIWLVFDRDHQTETGLRKAIEAAERAGFHVAFSDESFEVWLLLHFTQMTPNDRRGADYRINQLEVEIKKVTGLQQYKYAKSDDRFTQLYETRITEAIANAEVLNGSYDRNFNSPAPFASVGPLVKLLRGLT